MHPGNAGSCVAGILLHECAIYLNQPVCKIQAADQTPLVSKSLCTVLPFTITATTTLTAHYFF